MPADFDTIQAGIDASSPGDIVTVAPGTYAENIALKSGVDLRGRETARTILRPANSSLPVVSANGTDDVTFGNFTVIDAQVGVDVLNSTNLQVVNTVFDTSTQFGIRIAVDSQVDIVNCVFRDNAVAVRRSTADAQITNSGFVGNSVTISSPLDIAVDPNTNVDNCGFFDNDDLVIAGVDTGLGNNAVVGDPRFVAPDERDFHLRVGSPYIDGGIGDDSIDDTVADIGAYGGQFADPIPFPLPPPEVSDVSGASPPPFSAELAWAENLAYLVVSTDSPGSYRVYYRQNASGPPYDGTDAGDGTQPSPVEAATATSIRLDDLQPSAPPPDAPRLESAEPFSASVRLGWTAVAEAGAYRVHWGTTSVDENAADVGDVTTFVVGDLSNGVGYVFAVSALRQPVYHFSVTALDGTQNRNESDFSPESTLAIGPFTEGAQSNLLSATPAVTIPYPDVPDKGCFVATAAFGADWGAEVEVLRDLRDRHLLTSRHGRRLVAWYYRHGPGAARLIENNESARAIVRVLLYPIVAFALVLNAADEGVTTSIGLLCMCLLVSVGHRRRVDRSRTQ